MEGWCYNLQEGWFNHDQMVIGWGSEAYSECGFSRCVKEAGFKARVV